MEMKMVSSKEDERSLFVSGIVKNKDKYLFLVKNPEQWQQDENGRLRLPFGTVESRVARGETAESALMREFKKEIGTEVKIVNSETSHFIYNGQVDEMNMNARNNKPLFVYKEEKIEEDRRRFDYIYSFLTDAGKFDDIRPLNRNAVVLMNRDLLKKAAKGKLSVGELKLRGGRIISEIELPEDALLYPTPSSKGLYLCGRCH
jgi:NUDIX domain